MPPSPSSPDAFPRQLSSQYNLALAIFVPLAFALLHGAIRYGVGGIIVFLVLCLGVSNIYENMGVLTGFPFGRYHYTDVLGPKLFLVPLLIGPAYFGTGYVSWVLANILLGTDRRRDGVVTFLMPVVATFIMVGWDVCLDPSSSTVQHIWIWENGGGYFGVPLTNFLGWYLTVYTFLQLFALYLARRPDTPRPLTPGYWWQPSVMFLVMALDFPAGYFSGEKGPVTDATGRVWQIADINEAGAIVSIYTMLFVAVASMAVLVLQRRREAPDRS
jgi:Carotenoid biosynthesis protein